MSASKLLGAGVKGAEPLAYCTFGAACTEVELDMLTGEQRVLRSDILFDCGRSINPALDMGQVRTHAPHHAPFWRRSPTSPHL